MKPIHKLLLLLLWACGLSGYAPASDVVFFNQMEGHYRDPERQINQAIYQACLDRRHRLLQLLEKGHWRPSKMEYLSAADLQQQQLDPQYTYSVFNVVRSQEDGYHINTVIAHLGRKQEVEIRYEIESFFIEKFLKRQASIDFFFFLEHGLTEGAAADAPALEQLHAFDFCELASFSLKGGSLKDLGIDLSMKYFLAKADWVVPALPGPHGSGLRTAYDVDLVKEFLFRRLVDNPRLHLTPQLKKHLLAQSHLYALAFNRRVPEQDFYTAYKSRYKSREKVVQLYGEMYYATHLDRKRVLSQQEEDRYQQVVVQKLWDLYRLRLLENFNQYIDVSERQHNGLQQVDIDLDTGKLLAEIDAKIRDAVRRRLGELNLAGAARERVLFQAPDQLDVYGYRSGEFRLNMLHEEILDHLIAYVRKYEAELSAGQPAELTVKVAGYTDRDIIRAPYIRNVLFGQHQISYRDCSRGRRYLRLRQPTDQPVEQLPALIRSNCQLSVLRAYAFASHLATFLPGAAVFYAGGGEIRDGPKYYNRKVAIQIEMKGKHHDQKR